MTFNIPLIVLIAVLGLLGIGLYCLLASRNLIKVVVAMQIMVKGAMLLLVLVGRLRNQIPLAESMAFTVIVADTIVAVVGLALAVQIRRHFGTLDIKALTTLKR